MSSTNTRFPLYLAWICVVFYYMYQFVLRVSPGVLLDDFMLAFQITASEAGVLSAISLYSYALFQIPVGLIADRCGVRRVALASLILCVSGILFFISTNHLIWAKLGRFFIGAGSAGAFLCVNKVSAAFPEKKRAALLGLTLALGTIGALCGAAPLAYFASNLGWRESLMVLSGVGFFIFLLVFLMLRTRFFGLRVLSASSLGNNPRSIGEQLLIIIKNRASWTCAATALGIYLSISVLADLWGTSFISHAYGLERADAAKIVSLIYIGLCVGSLILTSVAEYLGRKKGVIIASLFGIVCLLSVIIYDVHLPLSVLSFLFFSIGFCAGAEMLCFAVAFERVELALIGTMTGFINTIVMFGGALIQEQVGRLLDYVWSGAMNQDGIRIYTYSEYRVALTILLATIVFSMLMAVFLPSKKLAKVDCCIAA